MQMDQCFHIFDVLSMFDHFKKAGCIRASQPLAFKLAYWENTEMWMEQCKIEVHVTFLTWLKCIYTLMVGQ